MSKMNTMCRVVGWGMLVLLSGTVNAAEVELLNRQTPWRAQLVTGRNIFRDPQGKVLITHGNGG